MANFEIIVGSVLGASEYVAEALQTELVAQNNQVNIHFQPDLAKLNENAIWLLCTSTHGAGDLPDNIQKFAKQITDKNLNHIKFLVIGLGDSSYDTFCYGAMQLEKLMLNAGASLLASGLQIDVLNHPIPEDKAVDWLKNWLLTTTLTN